MTVDHHEVQPPTLIPQAEPGLVRAVTSGAGPVTPAGDYRSTLARWDEVATVRAGPARVLDDLGVRHLYFSPELVPAVSHELVRARGPQVGQDLLVRRLYEYLTFTIELEFQAVLPVTNRIARGRLGLQLPGGMLHDAYKITTDEAWHAQFSHDLIRQVEARTGVPYEPHEPTFITRLGRVREVLEPELRGLADVMFAIVSETLISTILSGLPADRRLPVAVRRTIADHAVDEGRHHAYFRDLLRFVWPRLSVTHQRQIGPLLPQLIQIFLEPDKPALGRALAAAGLSPAEVRQVIEECHPVDVVTSDVAIGGASAVKYFTAVGALTDPATAAAFAQSSLHPPAGFAPHG